MLLTGPCSGRSSARSALAWKHDLRRASTVEPARDRDESRSVRTANAAVTAAPPLNLPRLAVAGSRVSASRGARPAKRLTKMRHLDLVTHEYRYS